MGTTPISALPFPDPGDRPNVPADIEALAVAVEARPAAKALTGTGTQSSAVESTTVDTPSSWVTAGAFTVKTGRRYRLTLAGVVDDSSTTNASGCGAWTEYQVSGAATVGATIFGRRWIATRYAAAQETVNGAAVVSATEDGTLTVSMRVTKKSTDGRARLTGGAVICEDIGPV